MIGNSVSPVIAKAMFQAIAPRVGLELEPRLEANDIDYSEAAE
jgi:hypothetical protein